MSILLDTCVLSEIRHPQGNRAVREAVRSRSDGELFLSVLTLGELAKGISLLDEGRRKHELESWLADLGSHYADRILAVDRQVALIWGEVAAAAQANGRTIPAIDGLIAATALRHGMSLMTRNTDDFAPMGVRLLNPWAPPGVHESS